MVNCTALTVRGSVCIYESVTVLTLVYDILYQYHNTYHIVGNLMHWLKCSKILNPFLFLFSNKMLVFRVGIHKILVRIAKREDFGLPCLSGPFVRLVFEIFEHLLYSRNNQIKLCLGC